ncbi:unnamed protein product, partial [Meganyctiphanes norvegica]
MEDSVLKLLETGTDQDIGRLLKEFNSKYEKQFTPVSGTSDTCKRLWKVIMSRLKDSQASNIHQSCLDTVRILSRDKSTLNDVIDQERLAVIVRLAGLVPEEEALQNLNQQINYEVVAEAQKCLSNLVFQSQAVQKWCCVNSCIPGLMCRLKTFRDPDLPHLVKYFDIRLLFLITATCPHVRKQIKNFDRVMIYFGVSTEDFVRPRQSFKISDQVDLFKVYPLSSQKSHYNINFLKGLYTPSKTLPESGKGRGVALEISLHCSSRIEHKLEIHLTKHTVNLLMVMPAQMYESLLTDMPHAAPQQPAAIGAINSSQPITTPPKACPMPSNFDDALDCASSGQTAAATESNAYYDACEYDGKDMSAIVSLLNFLDKRLNALYDIQAKELLP